jgi:anti-sigma factor RsiW
LNCDRCRELLSDHLDGRLSEEEERAFQTALDACPDCRAELREFEGMIEELRAVPTPRPPADLGIRLSAALREEIRREDAGEVEGASPSLLARLGRWRVAAAVLALGFGAWGFLRSESGSDRDSSSRVTPTAQTAEVEGGASSSPSGSRRGQASMSAVEAKDQKKRSKDALSGALDEKWSGEKEEELEEGAVTEDANRTPPTAKPTRAMPTSPQANPEVLDALDAREKRALLALTAQLDAEVRKEVKREIAPRARRKGARGSLKGGAAKGGQGAPAKGGERAGSVTLGESPMKDEESSPGDLRSRLAEAKKVEQTASSRTATGRSYILRGADEAQLRELLKRRGQSFKARDIALIDTSESAGRLIELDIPAAEAAPLLEALRTQAGARALLVATEYRTPAQGLREEGVPREGEGGPPPPKSAAAPGAPPTETASRAKADGDAGDGGGAPKRGSRQPKVKVPKKGEESRNAAGGQNDDQDMAPSRPEVAPKLRIRLIIPR